MERQGVETIFGESKTTLDYFSRGPSLPFGNLQGLRRSIPQLQKY
jgi:hypothetical protein